MKNESLNKCFSPKIPNINSYISHFNVLSPNNINNINNISSINQENLLAIKNLNNSNKQSSLSTISVQTRVSFFLNKSKSENILKIKQTKIDGDEAKSDANNSKSIQNFLLPQKFIKFSINDIKKARNKFNITNKTSYQNINLHNEKKYYENKQQLINNTNSIIKLSNISKDVINL